MRMATDGTGDDQIHIYGVEKFSFSAADAGKLPKLYVTLTPPVLGDDTLPNNAGDDPDKVHQLNELIKATIADEVDEDNEEIAQDMLIDSSEEKNDPQSNELAGCCRPPEGFNQI